MTGLLAQAGNIETLLREDTLGPNLIDFQERIPRRGRLVHGDGSRHRLRAADNKQKRKQFDRIRSPGLGYTCEHIKPIIREGTRYANAPHTHIHAACLKYRPARR